VTVYVQHAEFGIRIAAPEGDDYNALITRAKAAACDAVDEVLKGTDCSARYRSYAPPWIYRDADAKDAA